MSSGFVKQNNNISCALRFLHIALPSLHGYNVEMPDLTLYGGLKQATKKYFYFSF